MIESFYVVLSVYMFSLWLSSAIKSYKYAKVFAIPGIVKSFYVLVLFLFVLWMVYYIGVKFFP